MKFVSLLASFSALLAISAASPLDLPEEGQDVQELQEREVFPEIQDSEVFHELEDTEVVHELEDTEFFDEEEDSEVFHELGRRAVIGHDKVKGFSQKAPAIFVKFKPTLNVHNGCVPFPAVDKNGNTNGGLKNSGAMDGKCRRNLGQIYARGASRKGRYAIMYSWYFPKDQNVDGPGNLGHRHDWEHVVVWLSKKSTSAKVIGVSYSGHGKYTKVSRRSGRNRFTGSRVKVGYANYGLLNHSLRPDGGKGGSQPLIGWDNLTSKARNALNKTNFGKATVPFKPNGNNFLKRVDNSWHSSYN